MAKKSQRKFDWEAVEKYILNNPDADTPEVCEAMGVSPQAVGSARRRMKMRRKQQRKSTVGKQKKRRYARAVSRASRDNGDRQASAEQKLIMKGIEAIQFGMSMIIDALPSR